MGDTGSRFATAENGGMATARLICVDKNTYTVMIGGRLVRAGVSRKAAARLVANINTDPAAWADYQPRTPTIGAHTAAMNYRHIIQKRLREAVEAPHSPCRRIDPVTGELIEVLPAASERVVAKRFSREALQRDWRMKAWRQLDLKNNQN